MWSDVIITFMIAFIVSYICVPISMKIAKQVGAIDLPNEARKKHKIAMPRLGGIAIIIGFLVALIYAIATKVLVEGNHELFTGNLKILLKISLSMSLIALMGFLDDVYNLKSYVKLAFQAVAAIIIIVGGIRIEEISLPFLQNSVVFTNTFSYILTFFWIIGVTNAINLIDGLDRTFIRYCTYIIIITYSNIHTKWFTNNINIFNNCSCRWYSWILTI